MAEPTGGAGGVGRTGPASRAAPGDWADALVPHPETAGTPGERYPLAARMRLYNAPAVAVAIVDGGAVVEDRAFGTRAADDPAPVTAATAFCACSVSKAVAAAAALRLVAAGRLPLDADVNDHVRGWRLCDAGGAAARVTLRQLLTHTAGVNVHGAPGYDPAGPVPTLDDVFHGRPPSATPAVAVVAPPGAGYRYSGGGFVLVQKLVEDAAGQPFARAVDEWVFRPLAMRDSGFARPAGHAKAHVSFVRRAAPETDLAWPELAVAGLWTTAGDLARLAAALQAAHGGRGDFLPRDLAEDALRRQTPHRDVGLGLHLSGEGPARRFGHAGAHLGWRAEFVGWLDGRGRAVAVMLNNGYGGSELKSEILRAITATRGWPT